MAIFQAFNAAGIGFNMSATSPSGWTFVGTDPYIDTVNVYDDGYQAIFDVFGSDLIDRYTAWYESNGYDIVIDDLLYEDDGYTVLSIKDLGLYTTTDELEAYGWYINLNDGHDTFIGNDYVDVIRGGNGHDEVYGYGGDDMIFGDAGNDDLFGGIGDDDLYGGSGRDILKGESGSDYLSGGLGKDTLTGGAGQDYFVFDVKPSSTNADRIKDFKVRDDTISLDNQVFTRLGPDGWLSGSAFTTGSAARDASDRIIYNKKTGALLYDPDGTGHAAAIKFAQLDPHLSLKKHDFYVL